MFFLIPLVLIFGAAGGIGYIVWPKLKEARKENPTGIPEINDNFWDLMFPELIHFFKSAISKFKVFKDNTVVDYEKFLRRVRILSLKTDNFVNKLLEKRQKNVIKAKFKSVNDSRNGKAVDTYFKTKENNLIAEITKNPKDKDLYKSLAALYTERQMYEDAEEAYSVVLELDPNDLEAKEELEKMDKIV